MCICFVHLHIFLPKYAIQVLQEVEQNYNFNDPKLHLELCRTDFIHRVHAKHICCMEVSADFVGLLWFPLSSLLSKLSQQILDFRFSCIVKPKTFL